MQKVTENEIHACQVTMMLVGKNTFAYIYGLSGSEFEVAGWAPCSGGDITL